MELLTVKSVIARGHNLVIDFDCAGNTRKFFTGNRFFAQYDVPIDDVPEQILIIPFLSMACPIAWANHADIYVNKIDQRYLDSLGKVQAVLSNLFPKIGFSGNIYAEKAIRSPNKPRQNSMVLFSGGVDSLATYIRHKEEAPVLVSNQGADVQLRDFDRWEKITREYRDFAKQNGLKYRTVRSNFYDLFDHLMSTTFYRKLFNETWWVVVMHGSSFLGLCAPLTYVDEIGKLYIAASLTGEYEKPTGCGPEVENSVSWSGTSCSHDGYEISRQQKIQLIADYAKRESLSFTIRACGNRSLKAKRLHPCNCSSSKCEKCSRTILGLELAGLDPNEYGFRVTSNFFSEMQASIEKHLWKFDYPEKFVWKDILLHARQHNHLPHPEAGQFLDWLLRIDIDGVTSTTPEHLRKRIVLKVAPAFNYFPNWLLRMNRTVYGYLVD